jgi:hypothetical protein
MCVSLPSELPFAPRIARSLASDKESLGPARLIERQRDEQLVKRLLHFDKLPANTAICLAANRSNSRPPPHPRRAEVRANP